MVNHNANGFQVPEAPAIPGLVFRSFGGAADFPSMAVVINASLAADRNSERITASGLANVYVNPGNWDPQKDSLLVEVNGTLIGYANSEWRLQDDGDCLHFVHLHLVPAWRGCGLELNMHRHMEGCARMAASAGPDGAGHLFGSKVPETWQAYAKTLVHLGYDPVWYYFEMQRPLDGDLPEARFPAGLTCRPVLPEHYRTIWKAGEECFRDQQDHVAPSEASYRAWVATPDLDPSLWQVAWDGDQIAGAAINVVHEGSWGETDDLFVRRPWRKRGLGGALLAGSLHIFKARGLTTAGLGVEAENLSGALRLYENIGYQPYQRLAFYRKAM